MRNLELVGIVSSVVLQYEACGSAAVLLGLTPSRTARVDIVGNKHTITCKVDGDRSAILRFVPYRTRISYELLSCSPDPKSSSAPEPFHDPRSSARPTFVAKIARKR